MIKTVEMDFSFKNSIPSPPASPEEMHKQACMNDTVTIDHWSKQWIEQAKLAKARFGSFKEHGIGKLFGINKYKPAIVIGSGPSLANNIAKLKEAKEKGFMLISCLHNYQYMVDNGIDVDYYVSLDAGAVVTEEISEGGKLSHAEYVESTRGKKLCAYIGSHPSLFDSWKGEVFLFNCAGSGRAFQEEAAKLEQFHTNISTGGNVLGACVYIARAIFGSGAIIFTGADFCFGYKRQFHAWPSKYDGNVGDHALRCVDVWGHGVLTWQSYYNFKTWFDWLCTNVPGIYINCTEGGLLGSYPEGNIQAIRQMTLDDCLWMFTMHEEMRAQCENPEVFDPRVLF